MKALQYSIAINHSILIGPIHCFSQVFKLEYSSVVLRYEIKRSRNLSRNRLIPSPILCTNFVANVIIGYVLK